ncbi:MAG: 4Fe-4S dicluster domain-containing protein [Deltaproteobacteria bacterium]|nr:4Fe-4S dicluster domain-containing protein [Candidatus Anaeroferrophillus wilburensis]MBN2890046.1 4Fe-4S dicluster domain-containing protein [Deltaproteobacteria bacterium]
MSEGQKEFKIATGDRAILPEGTRLVPIYIMGKRYMVPETLTIQKATEYAGYQFIRACGCRGGICGACGTVYRILGDYHLHFGLACQTVVQENMYLTQVPFFPANRAVYNIEETSATAESIMKLYPEVMKCVACNTCTKACPMDIEVMEYVNAAMRGDLAKVARLSFDCIQCGLCSSRCPAQIQHFHLAQMCRRLYARYKVPQAEHLQNRVGEINEHKYDTLLLDLVGSDHDTLRKLYVDREMEPQDSVGWEPQDKTKL